MSAKVFSEILSGLYENKVIPYLGLAYSLMQKIISPVKQCPPTATVLFWQ